MSYLHARPSWMAVTALSVSLGLSASASAQEAETPDAPRSTGNDVAQTSQSSPDNAQNILTDADRVLYLAAKLEHAAKLRTFAAQRAQSDRVKAVAQQSAATLNQQATVLRQAAEQHAALRPETQQAVGAQDPDLSETVEEIGEAVRERLRQRAERRGEELAQEDDAQVDAVADVEIDEPALDDDGRRAVNRRDTRRERLADGRGDRDARRERIRVLLPALREELPDLLEVLGEAVEDETVGAAAWVDYQQKVADRVLQAKQAELERYQGKEFDQAVLGMLLVEAIELEAVAKTVAGQATPSLQQLLQTTTDQLRQEANESRDLMQKQYQRTGAQVSSNQQPASQAVAK